MPAHLIQTIEREEIARVTEGKKIPNFAPGDTLRNDLKQRQYILKTKIQSLPRQWMNFVRSITDQNGVSRRHGCRAFC